MGIPQSTVCVILCIYIQTLYLVCVIESSLCGNTEKFPTEQAPHNSHWRQQDFPPSRRSGNTLFPQRHNTKTKICGKTHRSRTKQRKSSELPRFSPFPPIFFFHLFFFPFIQQCGHNGASSQVTSTHTKAQKHTHTSAPC